MELMDMGRKEEGLTSVAPTEGKSKKVRISYPGFSMRGDSIPEEMKKATVGDMCRCEIVIKKIGDSIDTYSNQEPRVEVEIRQLGYLGKAGKLNKDEYLNASDEEREKNDKENMEAEPEEKEE